METFIESMGGNPLGYTPHRRRKLRPGLKFEELTYEQKILFNLELLSKVQDELLEPEVTEETNKAQVG